MITAKRIDIQFSICLPVRMVGILKRSEEYCKISFCKKSKDYFKKKIFEFLHPLKLNTNKDNAFCQNIHND
jgi:hypothetical protein